MKEVHLNLDTKTKELSFGKPEPYITIKIASEEAYEKLVDVISKHTPAEVEVEKTADYDGESCDIKCPECKEIIGLGRTVADAMRLLTRYCPNCGQALIREV